jgi:hypothetical protein
MGKIEKHHTSFRFKHEIMEMLEKIRIYEQSEIDNKFDTDWTLSNRHIIENLIKEHYQDLVMAGAIQE